MIPLAVPDLSGNEAKYLEECIKTTFVSSVGKFVDEFEELICKVSAASYGVATTCGTTGLHLALIGAGVKRDDLVIIPSFTFIATANAVAHCCAIPWIMDIDLKSWTLDPQVLEDELKNKTEYRGKTLIHKESGRRVAAVMPVYTLGMPADMDAINQIAQRYSLPVVADAAAALGARYKDRNIGELADFTVFSFNGNKTVTCGGGGMVVGRQKAAIEKIRHLSTTARVGREYDHDEVGYNYRMTNLQAAVGCAQLERLDKLVQAKRKISNYYRDAFRNMTKINLFPSVDWAESACWFSGIVLEQGNIEVVREWCVQLRGQSVEARPFWKPIHMQSPYRMAPTSKQDNAEYIWERILTLPSSTGITDVELKHVSDIVINFAKR